VDRKDHCMLIRSNSNKMKCLCRVMKLLGAVAELIGVESISLCDWSVLAEGVVS